MKKLNQLLGGIDTIVDKNITPWWYTMRRYIPLISATCISFLTIAIFWRIAHSKPDFTAAIISNDLVRIVRILNAIDSSCTIFALESERTPVNFLNTRTFSGSEIGGCALKRPKKWQGPYLQHNPTLQEKPYEIVKAAEGYFLMPGEGVTLPNGLIVGKDFLVTPQTPVKEMIQPGGNLNHKGEALAIQLIFHEGKWNLDNSDKKELEKVTEVLKEIREATPYAHNKKSGLGSFRITLPKKVS